MPLDDIPDLRDAERYGDRPAVYALEELDVSAVEVTDASQRGWALLLDVQVRASGEPNRRGLLVLLSPPMGAELAGELLDAATRVWGDDFIAALRARMGSRLTDLAIRAL